MVINCCSLAWHDCTATDDETTIRTLRQRSLFRGPGRYTLAWWGWRGNTSIRTRILRCIIIRWLVAEYGCGNGLELDIRRFLAGNWGRLGVWLRNWRHIATALTGIRSRYLRCNTGIRRWGQSLMRRRELC